MSLHDLVSRPPERGGKARVVTIPTTEVFEAAFAEPFLDAYLRFSEHCLAL
ncbi:MULTISPECIES: hypothetical protein [unclassified Neorhizobium]|uniref:hypothetical protein n=1 Tax=unclassified Neorhizobium TaxID=2629175 RepID=UPI001FF1F05E|nr:MULTISPECIES: hypothetical protein [unclassified Neorhizobium]MCJ9668992.1 hypothetical protein [Neorhizobium sp. SHOUNA12B]MCJ9744946.1 hypothetical protein [Neorhizobium sp. SHOUNA12A]